MKTKINKLISSCCNYKTSFCPPSLGDKGFYFCEKCNSECDVKETSIQTHTKISDGLYRPNHEELEKCGFIYKDIKL